jgi:hypothetical protein
MRLWLWCKEKHQPASLMCADDRSLVAWEVRQASPDDKGRSDAKFQPGSQDGATKGELADFER